jgi:DNA-directed RNA polymerase specialized sigma24 family protein
MDVQVGKLSDTQRAALIERYLAGESMTRLAPEFGVTRPAIAGLLRRRGIAVPPQAKLTELQRVEAVERYLRGQTCAEIATDFGVTGVAILGVLNRRGAPEPG